jgi:ATP-dependent helicase/nuclease subunit B
VRTLYFGINFDGNVLTEPLNKNLTQYCGENKLLRLLEVHLGLRGYPENTDYLRIELFRQALSQQLKVDATAFYARSFEADRFATATALLAWRDELRLAFWDFEVNEHTPNRLKTIAAVEGFFSKKLTESPSNVKAIGYADRYFQALSLLEHRKFPFEKVILQEPLLLLPVHIQRFIKIISAKNIPVEVAKQKPNASENSNLAFFQKRLAGEKSPKKSNVDDGSILILKAKRDADAAVFLAQTLAINDNWKPTFLIPDMSLSLEQAMVQEGLPASGILSASLARPSLQVLKLAPAFLWEPVDVFKIMEFVTLPVKPLDDGLAHIIGRTIAEKPGLFNDTWFARVYEYIENAENGDEVRQQYNFWFERRRFQADTTAAKRDVIGIYAYLQEWAVVHFEKTNGKHSSLLVLAEQARRVRELVEAIPEMRLTYLDLERIVRTIYEPSPVQMFPSEKNHYPYLHASGAFAAQTDELIWWNCIDTSSTPVPDKWTKNEKEYLENHGVSLNSAKKDNELRLFLRNQAVFSTQKRLIFVVPEAADGKDALPNLLLGDLEAAFENPPIFTFKIDEAKDCAALQKWLIAPNRTQNSCHNIAAPKPHLQLTRPQAIPTSEYESLSNLENLFYYPHKWFFRQKLRLFPASILSVTSDNTLLGSLAHRFFEMLLIEDFQDWTRQQVQDWIDEKSGKLLVQEGATLLLYGREPDKNRFLNQVKKAAWSLIILLKSNDWKVLHTEYDLQGSFVNLPVKGKADLILIRGDEHAIVDLKWRGLNSRKEMIKNNEDLQLVMYANLFPPEDYWAHTAYFIMQEGKIVARNKYAFKEAIVAGNDMEHKAANAQIYGLMEKTYTWRMNQIKHGLLEIRTQNTVSELDALYAADAFDILEMKKENARYDDYRGLISG